ncbi:MAG: ABC transporter permease [Treponema sp.]|nr:ABC transporter permease [Treponema sp.]
MKIKFWRRGENAFSRFPLGVYLLLLITVAAFFLSTGGIVGPRHLINVIRQTAPLGLVSIGQTLVLLMGGIDLSVGAVISLVNIVSAATMAGSGANIPAAVALSLGLALLVGLTNGLIIVRFNMPPFLVTMAMATIVQGAFFIYTKGSPRGSIAAEFRFISDGWIAGIIPVALLVWAAVWAVCSMVLQKTPFGKQYYFTGANARAAYLSGIHTRGITVSAYVLCSLMAGLAGLIVSAFIGVASSGVGAPYTTNSIAATVIGGTSFAGGVGSLEGTFPGVLILSFLQSILTMLNVPEAGKNISQGLIIIIMVAFNVRKFRK